MHAAGAGRARARRPAGGRSPRGRSPLTGHADAGSGDDGASGRGAANPSHALASVLIDELCRNGLAHACMAPGSRSTALVMALHDRPDVHLHVGIDERSVGFLALGLARAIGRPVAVVTTSGTAAVNLHPAVVEAHHARVPLLLLTADRPPELRHTAANQTIDQLRLYGAAVRWFVDMGAAEDLPDSVAYWRSTACRAWAAASGAGGPPGPVHLNLPFREPLVPERDDGRAASGGFRHPTDGRPDGRPWTSTRRVPRRPDPAELAELATLVAGASRGLLVVGDTDTEPAPLVAFAQRVGWPVVAEPLSGARSGRNAISTYHALLAHQPFAAAHRPDLVLRIGRVGLSRPLLRFLAADVPQVALDPDASWLDPQRSVAQVVAAEPSLVCSALAGRVEAVRDASGWLEGWRAAERVARAVVDEVLDGDVRATEPRTARDLAEVVPDGGTLVAASSMPVRDLDRFMRPRGGLRVVGNRGASGIDGLVSTALGVALAGEHPTFALAGDLSLLHDQNGFLLLNERPHLILVVLHNDGGAIFSFLPPARFERHFERLFATPHGRDLARLASLHDLGHERVESAADLLAAVQAARSAPGVQLLEVRTDRRENAALHRRLDQAVADALPRGAPR
ncbi:MAG TPA: 2-succinyl-5-enolpyruvyl-6-hydroxy-3-cyclohexene-1-carboxylic-acid synthase [Nitriliruptorales bacterium]|nr:2-succinyl-5-enolpyruvyl-6-hydroxy-3-cyclohexene-1-carboxylic-acid synthase [Nitriliruptorales bacterium]